jgi:hypothetical protein
MSYIEINGGFMTNREHKNSLFCWIFDNEDLIRELYGSIKDVSIGPEVPIEINTLENVIINGRVNDISFEIGNKLVVLIEHQSTINPNMPLRLLMYVARLYEKMIPRKKIYSAKQIKIPRPEFIVLYNGDAPQPPISTMALSDAFIDVKDEPWYPSMKNTLSLDLSVTVYNINKECNSELLEKCKTLQEYSTFIFWVKEFKKKSGILDEAAKQAINYCIKNNILKDILETHSSEVFNMLLTEWNLEDALEVRAEETREEIAINLLHDGMSVEIIAKNTGLDVNTISQLASQLN